MSAAEKCAEDVAGESALLLRGRKIVHMTQEENFLSWDVEEEILHALCGEELLVNSHGDVVGGGDRNEDFVFGHHSNAIADRYVTCPRCRRARGIV